MTAIPLPWPDVASLSDYLSADGWVYLESLLTLRPYGGRRRRTVFQIWLSGEVGVIRELADAGPIRGEHRFGGVGAASLDHAEEYLVYRRGASEVEPLARIFGHLAGPAAFAYGSALDRAWRRLPTDGRFTYFQTGPRRLRAVFDADTRLPKSAALEQGAATWEYAGLHGRVPPPPSVRGWRIEETEVVRQRPARRDEKRLDRLAYAFAPIDALMIERHVDPIVEVATFRTSSMADARIDTRWRDPEDAVPPTLLSLGISDDVLESYIESVLDQQRLGHPVRAGRRSGRLFAGDRGSFELLIGDRLDRPMEIETSNLPAEADETWRARIADEIATLR